KQDKYEKFIINLETQYSDYFHHKYNTPIPSVSDFQFYLGENDQSYVGYFTGEKDVYILTIDSITASLKRIENDRYKEKANELLNLVSDPVLLNHNYIRYMVLANHLYKDLFEPLSLKSK